MESIPVKRCTRCGETKPLNSEHFYFVKGKPNPYCKPCWSAYCRQRYQPKPPKIKPPKIKPDVKACPRCKRELPFTEEFFYLSRMTAFGLTSACRKCLVEDNRKRCKQRRVRPADARKSCIACGLENPATSEFFIPDNRTLDGFAGRCRACFNERAQERYDPKRKRERVQEIPGKRFCRSCGQYLPSNLEHFPADNRWGSKLGSKCRKCSRAYSKFWKAQNQERVYAHNADRRARKAAAEGTHTKADVRKQYANQQGKCYWCRCRLVPSGKGRFHVDHLIPLDRGGSNGPKNIVCACPTCNASKGTKLPHEWIGRLL